MNIVITSTGNAVSAAFDRRFGRAAWFCRYDTETKQLEFIENQNKDAVDRAGTMSARRMIELRVNKVISGDFGLKAKEILDKSRIQLVIPQGADLTIRDIISILEHR